MNKEKNDRLTTSSRHFFFVNFSTNISQLEKKTNFLKVKRLFFSVLSMWKKSKQTLHNILWNWEKLVKQIGENIWWTDQKIVNGDKQKKKKDKTKVTSVAFLQFLLQYQEILLITTTLQFTYLHQKLHSKIAPSRRHLLVEKRTILAIWLSSQFF